MLSRKCNSNAYKQFLQRHAFSVVNTPTGEHKLLPLHIALERNYLDVSLRLLHHGADLRKTDEREVGYQMSRLCHLTTFSEMHCTTPLPMTSSI